MPYVPVQVIRMYEANHALTPKDILGVRNVNGDEAAERTRRRYIQYLNEGVADPNSPDAGIETEVNDSEIERIKKLAKNKFVSLMELSTALDRSELSVLNILETMQEKGINIEWHDNQAHLSTLKGMLPKESVHDPIAVAANFKCAVISDWHCGSIYEQHTHLMQFIDTALETGYRHFMVPGDLTEGLKMRTGHEIGMYVHDVDSLEELIMRPMAYLPSDAHMYLIEGNHDHSVVKNCHTDVVWRAANQFDNVHFLGWDRADIPVTDKHSLRMWHPAGGGGVNPAIKIQKEYQAIAQEEMISELDAYADDSNVKVLLVAHLHIFSVLQHGMRFGAQVGCFQGQTDFLIRLGLVPSVGGCLLDFQIGDNGDIVRWNMEFMPRRPIKEDYKYFSIPSPVQIETVERMVRIG